MPFGDDEKESMMFSTKGKIQSSEQGPNLRVAIINTGYIKKPVCDNFSQMIFSLGVYGNQYWNQ